MSNGVEKYINLEWTKSIKIALFIFELFFWIVINGLFLYLKDNLVNHYLDCSFFFIYCNFSLNEPRYFKFLFYDDLMCILSSIIRVNSVMTCDILYCVRV